MRDCHLSEFYQNTISQSENTAAAPQSHNPYISVPNKSQGTYHQTNYSNLPPSSAPSGLFFFLVPLEKQKWCSSTVQFCEMNLCMNPAAQAGRTEPKDHYGCNSSTLFYYVLQSRVIKFKCHITFYNKVLNYCWASSENAATIERCPSISSQFSLDAAAAAPTWHLTQFGGW